MSPVSVAGGDSAGYTIGGNGTLYAWGAGDHGQLGNGTTPAAQATPVAVSLSLPLGDAAASVAGSSRGGYAVDDFGNICTCGDSASPVNSETAPRL